MMVTVHRHSISSSTAGAGQHHVAATGAGGTECGGQTSASETTREKLTMQNLNKRLASYLDKVRCLESANRKLRLQIENTEAAPVSSHDFTVFFAAISDLQTQVTRRYIENRTIVMETDKTRRSMDELKIKYDAELQGRTTAEVDAHRLHCVCGDLIVSAADLQRQLSVLQEELQFVQRSHEEEMLKPRWPSGVHVQVDSRHSADLTAILQEVRRRYEDAAENDKRRLEEWFQTKVSHTNPLKPVTLSPWQCHKRGVFKRTVTSHPVKKTTVTVLLQRSRPWNRTLVDLVQTPTCSTDVQRSEAQLSNLKRTFQSLETELQKELTQKMYRQQELEEVQSSCSAELQQLQQSVVLLEAELQWLKDDVQQQSREYQQLLDVSRLKLEISQYHRLLDGEQEDESRRLLDQGRQDESGRLLNGEQEDESGRLLNGEQEDESGRLLDQGRRDESGRLLDQGRQDESGRLLDQGWHDESRRLLDVDWEDRFRRLLVGDREDRTRRVRASWGEYQLLLDARKRLEMEIAEYRRRLEGNQEDSSTRLQDGDQEDGSRRPLAVDQKNRSAVITETEKKVKERKPRIELRVRTIVEDVVDGEVVSSSTDTQVLQIQ